MFLLLGLCSHPCLKCLTLAFVCKLRSALQDPDSVLSKTSWDGFRTLRPQRARLDFYSSDLIQTTSHDCSYASSLSATAFSHLLGLHMGHTQYAPIN